MDGVLHLWSEWEVQILVLVSFALQLFLFTFAGIRRHNISRGLRDLLWLLYLLAESIATYTIGHMSISCKPGEHRQLMAFWAPFLLVHLGGQDTITAYAMEDNDLWGRHLLTLVVQAIGVAYVLYKYIPGGKPLVMAAGVLMLAVGVIKYGERVWALKSSKLDSISKFLDKVEMEDLDGPYNPEGAQRGDDEEILQGAQDLLYICMGQFADYKVWPSKFQSNILRHFHEEGKLWELMEMQLTLMHEIFYTKAQVIHTCLGYSIRVFTLLGTVMALLLFQFAGGKGGYSMVDVVVTYTLLAGACLLELASASRAALSTWTCAMLKAKKWVRLHSLLVSLRRKAKAARIERRWSGFIGQHNLVESHWHDRVGLRRRVISYWKKGSTEISTDSKDLVLKEIFKMVEACGGDEDVLRSYRGQCTLGRLDDEGGFLELPLSWSTRLEFDDSILQWHYATDLILYHLQDELKVDAGPTGQTIKALSNYMMFLFVQHPHLLPGPVRLGPYLQARETESWTNGYQKLLSEEIAREDYRRRAAPELVRGVIIAGKLRKMWGNRDSTEKLLEVLLGVWVEMLCYAAHHCNRDSHARQLNAGGEFITVVWLLTTAAFNRVYCDQEKFKKCAGEFFDRRMRSSMSFCGLLCFCFLCLVLQCCSKGD